MNVVEKGWAGLECVQIMFIDHMMFEKSMSDCVLLKAI